MLNLSLDGNNQTRRLKNGKCFRSFITANYILMGNMEKRFSSFGRIKIKLFVPIRIFRSKLPDDMKDEFESLMDSHLDLLPLELEQNFIDGFRIGARMMAEVFCGESLAELKEAQKAAASKKI